MEKRLLLDPVQDPIEEWLTIDANDLTGKLIPDPALNSGQRERMQRVIDLLGLNVDPLLRKERSNAYQEAVSAAAEKHWDTLRRNSMRHRPHSLIPRIVLQRFAPEHLPTPQEETRDLAESLWNNLATVAREVKDLRLRASHVRQMEQSQLDSLVWALIVLSADPPGGDLEIIDTFLADMLEREETEIKVEIISLFSKFQQQLAESKS